ncbi:MAG: DNA polymerase I, partial [Chloroflexi bacterium]
MKGLLLLFDGNALIHRAFHALPNLTTKDGEPTGALYGFVSMVLKVLQEFKPSYWAVAFDHPSPTFRHEIFPQYKAQRPKAPDELAQQIRKMRELVKAFNIPSFEVPGYEADDILGTLAKQARDRGIRTIIVTGDTDTLQLVRDGVEVLLPRPGRPFSDTQLYDEKAVKEKYGLWPWQIPDLKGLKGDPSDNIPGVSGVGQKTTLRLIQGFGSVEEIYRRLDEVEPPKLREILRQNEKTAKEGKELATIKSDVPITLDLDSCRVSGYDRERVKELFREFEFFSLLNKLPETIGQEERVSARREVAPETCYQLVTDAETLDGLLEELAKAEWLVIDTETTSQDARKAQLVGLSLSTRPGRA